MLSGMRKHLFVSAAIIEKDGAIFSAQRSNRGETALKWEFPGGKIEAGESAQEALVREIFEELDTQIEIVRPWVVMEHQYEGFDITLNTFICHVVKGELTLKEHINSRWLRKEELFSVDWAEADIKIAQSIDWDTLAEDFWFSEGLRFSCMEGCNRCCGESEGYAYLSLGDLQALAQKEGLTEAQTIKAYCREVDLGDSYLIALKEETNYDCIFLKEGRCTRYECRPFQCAAYPFWPNVLESSDTWEAEKSSCPGIGHGRLWTAEEIKTILRAKTGMRLLRVPK